MVIDRVARQLGDGARTDSRLAIFKRAEHELNYYPSLPSPRSPPRRESRRYHGRRFPRHSFRAEVASPNVLAFRIERPAEKSEGTDLRKSIGGLGGEFGEQSSEGKWEIRETRRVTSIARGIRLDVRRAFFLPASPLPLGAGRSTSPLDGLSSAGRPKGEAFCDRDPARALVLIRDIAMVPEDQYGNDE